MTIIIAAVIAVLSAQPASAEQRANKPFTTVNGRSSSTGAAGARPAAGNAGGFSAVKSAPASPNDEDRPTGGRAFIGRGSRVAGGSAARGGRKSFWGGKVRKDDGGAPGGAPPEELPPNFTKPGALISSTGQAPVYEKTESRTFTVEGGEIAFNPRKAIDVGRAPSLQMGPKDTLPPPNPADQRGYGSGAFSNARPASGAGSPGTGNLGGKDNNGGGNNDKNKPGDDDDKTGFNSSF